MSGRDQPGLLLTRGLPVGPLSLELRTEREPLDAPLDDLLEGWEPPADGRPRRPVFLDIERSASVFPEDTRGVAFRHAGPGLYRDPHGELGALELEGFEAGAIGPLRVTARVRPIVDRRAYWRDALKMLVRSVTATAAVLEDALLIHGCAMVPPGGDSAVLFAGPSGHGKTTLARRLEGWTLLGDDTLLVEVPRGAPVTVAGTPLSGKEGLPRSGGSVPLERILLLEPGASRLSMEPVSRTEAFRQLVDRTFWFVADGPLAGAVLEGVDRLTARVAVERLASGLHHDVGSALTDGRREVA